MAKQKKRMQSSRPAGLRCCCRIGLMNSNRSYSNSPPALNVLTPREIVTAPDEFGPAQNLRRVGFSLFGRLALLLAQRFFDRFELFQFSGFAFALLFFRFQSLRMLRFQSSSSFISPRRRQLMKIILRHVQSQSPIAGARNIFPKLDFIRRENLHALATA